MLQLRLQHNGSSDRRDRIVIESFDQPGGNPPPFIRLDPARKLQPPQLSVLTSNNLTCPQIPSDNSQVTVESYDPDF